MFEMKKIMKSIHSKVNKETKSGSFKTLEKHEI